MTRTYTAGGDLLEAAYIYHADHSHAGSLSCDKDVLEARGVIDLWDAPEEHLWEVEVECNWLPEYREAALNPTDPELIAEKEEFFNRLHSLHLSLLLRDGT